MPWLASSQTLSNKEEYCSVPCRTLKNALIVKNEYEFAKGQLAIARDSIYILSNIVNRQDSLILIQDSTINLYKTNETRHIKIISNQDKIIQVKDKQIKQAKIKTLTGWVVATVTTTLLVIKLL